jgi:hypothetical protein
MEFHVLVKWADRNLGGADEESIVRLGNQRSAGKAESLMAAAPLSAPVDWLVEWG